MIVQMQQRKGEATEWEAVNPVLAAGEIGAEIDTGLMKVGDGTRAWNDLDYSGSTSGGSTETFGQIGHPYHRSIVPTTKATLSVTYNTLDGYDSEGPLWTPTTALDVAECNWTPATIVTAGLSGTLGYNQTGPGGGPKAFDFTVILDGDYFFAASAHLGNYYENVRVWIDDEPVGQYSDGPTSGAPGNVIQSEYTNGVAIGQYVFNLKFARRGTYKIRMAGIQYAGPISLFGTNKQCLLRKPKDRKTIAVISDSWFDTTSYTSLNTGICIGAELDARIWNCAQGGSGFVNPSNGGIDGDRSYGSDQVFAALAKCPQIDAIIVNGSCNDLGYTDAQVSAKMISTFDRIRSVYGSEMPIVWVGLEPQSYFKNLFTLPVIQAREALLNSIAQAHPSVVGTMLPAAEQWLTGTGSKDVPTGVGNQDFTICQDTIHPSQYGTKWYGLMIAERMKSFLTTPSKESA